MCILVENILNEIISRIKNNKGGFLGGLLGFIIAISVLSMGFIKTFFIVFCTVVGYHIGKRGFTKEDIKVILEKLGKIIPFDSRN